MKEVPFLEKLAQMGIELPPAPAPVPGAAYDPAIQVGSGYDHHGLVLVSGQIPDVARWGGKRLGEDLTEEELAEAARECTLKALAAMVAKLQDDGDRRKGRSNFVILGAKATVFLLAPDQQFGNHPSIANGATEILKSLGIPVARSAVGVSSLPLKVPVEVQLDFVFFRGHRSTRMDG